MHMRLNLAMLVACVCSVTLVARPAFASLFAHDDASQAAYSDGWQTGDNGGTGTWGGGWTFRNQSSVELTATNGNRGWFVASSLNNDNGETDLPLPGDSDINTTGNKAWGVYSNSTDHVYAIRPLSGALAVGDTVEWYMDNGGIGTPNVVGLRFLSDAADIASRVFEARFVGGDSFYTLIGSPNQTTTIGFTRQGLKLEYTLTSASTFSLKITRLENLVTQTLTGSNVNANSIVALAFKNQLAGSGGNNDAYLNSITVTPVPEASAIWLCTLTMLYLARHFRRRTS